MTSQTTQTLTTTWTSETVKFLSTGALDAYVEAYRTDWQAQQLRVAELQDACNDGTASLQMLQQAGAIERELHDELVVLVREQYRRKGDGLADPHESTVVVERLQRMIDDLERFGGDDETTRSLIAQARERQREEWAIATHTVPEREC